MSSDHKGDHRFEHRLDRDNAPTIKAWKWEAGNPQRPASNVAINCGWGRLIFGHTFESNELIAKTLMEEGRKKRDLAFYISDPHVVLAFAPQDLFLDPSHTYRLYLEQYRQQPPRMPFTVRRLQHRADAVAMNELYERRNMVRADAEFVWEQRKSRVHTYLVAQETESGELLGSVLGVDHKEGFDDPENGCSLWALAVDPRCNYGGVGHALVSHLIEHYIARGRSFMDLSVMHDNDSAIALYERFGFQRVPVFCVKRKNPINEHLFIADAPEQRLNPYAAIIVREAQRRGISVKVVDEESSTCELAFGGRSIVCRESLSELTSAIALQRCDDKRLTRRILTQAGLSMPAQRAAGTPEENAAFLERFERVVVKPVRGEQGHGVAVDLRTRLELEHAVATARDYCEDVILEEFIEGLYLRIIVINYKCVAAAVRRPPKITGTGEDTIRVLIKKTSKRRAAATGGESKIPMDAETERCVRQAGYGLDDVLPAGEHLVVRKTANLHTGGTIHDVTAQVHPAVIAAAERAAEAIAIPVAGLDLIVPEVESERYWFIEVNERPGLANHEPQPTAERFVDLLFPQTANLVAPPVPREHGTNRDDDGARSSEG